MNREEFISFSVDCTDINCNGLNCRQCTSKMLEKYEWNIREELAHELKETFNQEFPSNYPSVKPFFTLENARLLVDKTLEQMQKGNK